MTEDTLDEFEILDDLRKRLSFYKGKHRVALEKFFREKVHGFCHMEDDLVQNRPSLSSTATCYVSSIRAGLEDHTDTKFLNSVNLPHEVIRALIGRDWNSAKLRMGNAFSVAFALEAVAEISLLSAKGAAIDIAIASELVQELNETKSLHPKLESGFSELLKELVHGEPMGVYEDNEPPRKDHDKGRIAMSGYPASAYLTQLAWRAIKRFQELLKKL